MATASSLTFKKMTLNGSPRVLLDFWSGGPAPIETKYVEYLISGLLRESECLRSCPYEIMDIIEKYTFKIEMIHRPRREMESDLLEACRNKDIWMMRQILAIDETVVRSARDMALATCLMITSENGYYDGTQELLETETIDINARNIYGMNALHVAAMRGRNGICELLIEYGISIDYVTPCGSRNDNVEIVKVLLNLPDGIGNDPNLPNSNGRSPLWIASLRGNVQCMKLLIQYGVDLNVCDDVEGTSPLFEAVKSRRQEAINMLLTANADPTISRKEDGITTLMIAVQNGDIDIVQQLYRACARMLHSHQSSDFGNTRDSKNGWTALHWACTKRHENMVKYLVEDINVDIHIRDFRDESARDLAKKNGHESIARWLSELSD